MTHQEISKNTPEQNFPNRNKEQKLEKKNNRKIKCILFVLLLLLLLLLLKSCSRPFDYFYEKASTLDFEPEKIVQFIRDEMPTLSYRGNVKGALGALWHGSASPEEKLELAKTLLAYCDKPFPIRLAQLVPQDLSKNTLEKNYLLTLTHRLKIPETTETMTFIEKELFSVPIHSLIGEIHSIEIAEKTVIILRGKSAMKHEIAREKAISEEILFEIEDPKNPEKSLLLIRELWNSQTNQEKRNKPQKGTVHDFVVVPSRISEYVLQKEEILLTQQKRKKNRESYSYLKLLDYMRDSDEILSKIETEFKVLAEFQWPRILMLSTFPKEEQTTVLEKAYALDLRQNYTTFIGETPNILEATAVRSFVELSREQFFLENWTKLSSFSMYELLNQLQNSDLNSSKSRVHSIRHALWILQKRGLIDSSKIVFKGKSNQETPEKIPSIIVSLTEHKKIQLTSVTLDIESIKQIFSQRSLPAHFKPQQLESVLKLEEATEVIEAILETTLLSPYYSLEIEFLFGEESQFLVTPGARFEFKWQNQEKNTTQTIHIENQENSLNYHWEIKNGLRFARGKREISQDALLKSKIHNPWYGLLHSNSKQENATSFCVSQEVFHALKKNKKSEFALQKEMQTDQITGQEREIEHKGELFFKMQKKHAVLLNNKKTEIPILVCEFQAKTLTAPLEITLLDSPNYPIGKAEQLLEIDTEIRGRLVDENNLGIADAEISLESSLGEEKADDKGFGDAITALSGKSSLKTWPDGSFRLPPLKKKQYQKTTLKIVQGTAQDSETQQRELDLSAPGLDEILVQVPRHIRKLEWIEPSEIKNLDSLPLSNEVKTRAQSISKTGKIIIIPNKMFENGLSIVIGFLSYDQKTGEIIGVTEDGLYGGFSDYGILQNQEENLKSNPPKIQEQAFIKKMQSDLQGWKSMQHLFEKWNFDSELKNTPLKNVLLEKNELQTKLIFNKAYQSSISFLDRSLKNEKNSSLKKKESK